VPEQRGEEMARKIQTRLPLTPMAGARARRCLEPLRAQIDPRSFESLRLLVTELVNNSLNHSGRPEGDPITLTVELGNHDVHAEVVDRGTGGLVRRPLKPDAESGWGLYLVDRLADDWGYSRQGHTRVWFVLSTRSNGKIRPFPSSWPEGSQAGSA
jgi:anti-sigma regulatory factor (Ser/Thr protein kinase)